MLVLVLLIVQAREVACSQLAIGSAEQLQHQLPLLHLWGAAAPADSPEQPEGFTVLPPGRAAADTRVFLQQAAPWGVPVPSPFTWQQAVSRPAAGQQQEQLDELSTSTAAVNWVDVQVRSEQYQGGVRGTSF